MSAKSGNKNVFLFAGILRREVLLRTGDSA